MQSLLKILFLDDHEGIRDGIGFLLSNENKNLSFIYAASIEESLDALQNNSDIALAIIDLNLDGKDGLLATQKLRELKENLPVIIYTMYSDPLHIEKALKAGVQGYVTKNAKTSELLQAIELVSKGGNYFNAVSSKVMKTLLSGSLVNDHEKGDTYSLYKNLTKSEQQVFYLLAQKKEPEVIAKELGKKLKTIINQRSIIYQKLNISDRLDLIEFAKRLGFVFDDENE